MPYVFKDGAYYKDGKKCKAYGIKEVKTGRFLSETSFHMFFHPNNARVWFEPPVHYLQSGCVIVNFNKHSSGVRLGPEFGKNNIILPN